LIVGLWIGTIGKVLYGEVSAGITNVDITYTRFISKGRG